MRIYKWEGLPDPRDPQTPTGTQCTVVLYEQCLAHIVQRHISQRDGPWAEWLSEKLCEYLIRWFYGEQELTPEVRDELGQRLGEQLAESLNRPLVIVQFINRRHDACIALTPSGALLILHCKGDSILIVTSYYVRKAVQCISPSGRWRRALTALVWRYCDLVNCGGALRLVPTKDGHIRWVSLKTWGFDTSGPQPVWCGRLSPWPAAERLSPPTPQSRIKLRKRKHTIDLEPNGQATELA
ncbi:hypothetical protein HRbin36_00575 [bacterium HR36]|nr:hypothetical protein HRbin36_00575 [bacterium HR36]